MKIVIKRLDRCAVLRGQRQREETGQGLGVGRVGADPRLLAANLVGSCRSVLLTPMLPALEPVKKVLIPRAASVPLVSSPKANCVFAPVAEMVNWPSETWADRPLTPLISAARLLSVVSWPAPSRATGYWSWCCVSVCVFVTMIWNEPLVGVNARPAWLSGASAVAHRVEAGRLRVARGSLAAGIDLVELVGQRGGKGIQLVLESAEHVVARVISPCNWPEVACKGGVDAFDWIVEIVIPRSVE